MNKQSLSERIQLFNQNLSIPVNLPQGVVILNPFKNPATSNLSASFYKKYYNDQNPRTMILGINPGRLGAGLTGVPFTDPINLYRHCDIKNELPQKHELSSEFIYRVITDWGGAQSFYQTFYFSSISPLGFIYNKKNLNYYDIKGLPEKLTNFIVQNLSQQMNWGIKKEIVFCMGEGKNYQFLSSLNNRYHFFDTIIPLPHPRYIMQYKRKKLADYIKKYINTLKIAL